MSENVRLGFIAALGILGGFGVIAMARDGLSEGLTEDERKGLFAMMAIGVGGYAAAKLWQLDKQWWFALDKTATEALDKAVIERQP